MSRPTNATSAAIGSARLVALIAGFGSFILHLLFLILLRASRKSYMFEKKRAIPHEHTPTAWASVLLNKEEVRDEGFRPNLRTIRARRVYIRRGGAVG